MKVYCFGGSGLQYPVSNDGAQINTIVQHNASSSFIYEINQRGFGRKGANGAEKQPYA